MRSRFEPDPPHTAPSANDGLGAPASPTAGAADALLGPEYDFSLVLGGPLYQLLRRAHLSGDVLELLRRRVIVIAAIAWLPLFALSAIEGRLWDGGVVIPFLRDADVQVRFLVALPLLVIAELLVYQRMRLLVRQFLDRSLVPAASRERFDRAVASALRLRNSVVAEMLLIAAVYTFGLLVWRNHAAIEAPSWYGSLVNGRLQPTAAGWWLGLVSLPLFQFLLARWYFRLIIWARFLWQVSRIDLNLAPLHPDRTGGLGFLTKLSYAFAPLLVAQGVLLAGTIANQIFYAGATLPQAKIEIAAAVLVALLFVVGPLIVFAPQLEAAKRAAIRRLDGLALRYAREFDDKWLRGAAPEEPLIGSADIQSLADLGNSYEIVKQMKWMPVSVEMCVRLGVAMLLPLLPLSLTMISLEELLDRLLKVVL